MSKNRIYKRAKILATIGPATPTYESILGLIQAGVNGCRLNFSHGTYEEREQQLAWIRRASRQHGKPVTIVQDLCGPKIRLGDFGETKQIPVSAGQELHLTYGAQYDGGQVIPTQYDLSSKVKIGERLYIYDGKIRTTVLSVASPTVVVRVENDGIMQPRKGINLPDTDFAGDILTEKDREDIRWGAHRDIDYVAISFVQRASDVEESRAYIRAQGSNAKIISKIETAAAISHENLEGIVKASDVVMVARGDMGIETSFEIVPIAQRRILELAHKYSRICIIATQMLISMVDNPTPTRPEVSDIANAVIAGADCLMLSEETANGRYPLESVQTMKKVIIYTQEHVPVKPLPPHENDTTPEDAVSAACVSLAHQVGAKAIICETKTGATALSIAAHRPGMPIMSVTSDPRVAQQLSLLYANKSFLITDGEASGLCVAQELRHKDFFDAGSLVVIVSGKQPGVAGGTDTICVRRLE